MASRVSPSRIGEKKSGKASRAILKDALPCSCGEARAIAPRGEYDIEKMEATAGLSSVGLCSCATQNRFTLSFDAFLQHVNEGRIALIRG